jgi:hypothetical protein
MRTKIFIFFCAFILSHSSAFALGKVSRACRVSDIPAELKSAAMIAFEVMGSAPIGSLYTIPLLPIDLQRQHLILESLTVDGYNRYYLFAEANVTQYWWTSLQDIHPQKRVIKYSSPSFEATSFSNELVNYLYGAASRFISNRTILISSRAGHPNIVQYWPNPTNEWTVWYEVIGRHYYYDPVSKLTKNMGYTKANDCNLSEWGNPFSLSDR